MLEDNKVSWKIYQGYHNYGDNALAYFNNFRRGGDKAKIDKARSFAGKNTDDDTKSAAALIASLRDDIRNKKLPAVSWIVAPKTYSEHPEATSSDGEKFTREILDAIMSNEDVWKKCAIFITYDENDGYFDHVPPPIPPVPGYGEHNLKTSDGKKSIDLADEMHGSEPIGLGPRVPMMVVSPFSKGGRVSSRLSDHTSIIRFLETWLVAKGKDAKDVRCDNISAWRRAVCDDLTETLNFTSPVNTPSESDIAGWKITEPSNGPNNVYSPYPYSDGDTFLPNVADVARPACPLPYDCGVLQCATSTDKRLDLLLDNNTSSAAATFIVYVNALTTAQKVLHYTVAAGSELNASVNRSGANSQCQVFGPAGNFWKF